MNVMDEVPPDC